MGTTGSLFSGLDLEIRRGKSASFCYHNLSRDYPMDSINSRRVDFERVAPEAGEAEGKAKFKRKFTPVSRN